MKRRKVLAMIKADIVKDVAELEGQLFTGRNVARAFEKQAALLSALTEILLTLLPEEDDE